MRLVRNMRGRDNKAAIKTQILLSRPLICRGEHSPKISGVYLQKRAGLTHPMVGKESCKLRNRNTKTHMWICYRVKKQNDSIPERICPRSNPLCHSLTHAVKPAHEARTLFITHHNHKRC